MRLSHTAAVAALIATLAVPAFPALSQTPRTPAQADQDHNAHHPGGDQKTAPPAGAAPATPARPGMGGMGMMQGGMMQGGQGQMPMMGNMGQMMGGDMHRMMEMMHGRGMMMDGGARHLEGRLAFLKTELQITSAQENAWNAFAEAMRKAVAAPAAAGPRQDQASKSSALPDRLDDQVQRQQSRVSMLQAKKAAVEQLYRQLSAEQKKMADDLIEQIGLV